MESGTAYEMFQIQYDRIAGFYRNPIDHPVTPAECLLAVQAKHAVLEAKQARKREEKYGYRDTYADGTPVNPAE